MSYYNYIKALHLIFVITWFAGLFYMPRLFIYWIEAQQKEATARDILTKQFQLMAHRLWYIITWPSAILTVLSASALLYLMPNLLLQSWMWVKLGFVGALVLYHLKTHRIFKKMQRDEFPYSSNFMRIWNEGATLLLFAIVFLAILKNSFHWIFGVVGILLLGVLLMLGIRLYKRLRKKGEE